MKILFTASESLPFIKTGGLGDVAYALPKALADAGHEVKVIIPFYGRVKHGEALSRNINFVGETKPLSAGETSIPAFSATEAAGAIPSTGSSTTSTISPVRTDMRYTATTMTERNLRSSAARCFRLCR